MRRVILACALWMGIATSAAAGTIGPAAHLALPGLVYSRASLPFEAFEWSPLDIAAFGAYGGDFVNVRKPVIRINFVEDPLTPSTPRLPEDEQAEAQFSWALHLETAPQKSMFIGEFGAFDEGDTEDASVPEPGALALIGLGLLGASARLRRGYRTR